MRDTVWLFIEERPASDRAIRWAACDREGSFSHGATASLDTLPQAKRNALVLAAGLTTAVSLTLPAKGRALFLKSLAAQVEERTLLPLERIHAVAGPPDNEGRCDVQIVDADFLRETLKRFARIGIEIDAVVAESELFAQTAQRPALLAMEDASLYLPADGPPLLLDLPEGGSLPAGARPDDIEPCHRYGEDGGEHVSWRWKDAVGRVASTDLLAGSFAPPSPWITGLKSFSGSLPLLTALLATLCLSLGVQWWGLKKEKETLKRQMKATLTETFPEVTVIVDPPLQMRQKIDELQKEVRRSSPSAPLFISMIDLLRKAAARQIPLVRLVHEDERLILTISAEQTGAVTAMQGALPGVAPRVMRQENGTIELVWPVAAEVKP